jgi:hypothetical protein
VKQAGCLAARGGASVRRRTDRANALGLSLLDMAWGSAVSTVVALAGKLTLGRLNLG